MSKVILPYDFRGKVYLAELFGESAIYERCGYCTHPLAYHRALCDGKSTDIMCGMCNQLKKRYAAPPCIVFPHARVTWGGPGLVPSGVRVVETNRISPREYVEALRATRFYLGPYQE